MMELPFSQSVSLRIRTGAHKFPGERGVDVV
jgi:hypothetical protein